METTPIQPRMVIRPNVWMEPNPKAMMAATATKMAVHAP